MKNRTGDTDPESATDSASHLLDDDAVQRFIVDGYITLRPALPDASHSALRRQLDALIALEGNPGNDLLPKVPELSALSSLPMRPPTAPEACPGLPCPPCDRTESCSDVGA